MYLYSSSTKKTLFGNYRAGWHPLWQKKKGGKASKCLQRAEQRVLLPRGLCAADMGSVNREPPHLRRTFMETWQLQHVKGCAVTAAATTGCYYILTRRGLCLKSSFKKKKRIEMMPGEGAGACMRVI